MKESSEEKRLEELNEEIKQEKEEIKDLENVLNKERKELDDLEKERDELEHHHKPHKIIVNSTEHEYAGEEISFREVVLLAFPDAKFDGSKIYNVAYTKGGTKNPQGTMTDGGKKVHVVNCMVFEVERHDKS